MLPAVEEFLIRMIRDTGAVELFVGLGEAGADNLIEQVLLPTLHQLLSLHQPSGPAVLKPDHEFGDDVIDIKQEFALVDVSVNPSPHQSLVEEPEVAEYLHLLSEQRVVESRLDLGVIRSRALRCQELHSLHESLVVEASILQFDLEIDD